MVQHWTAFLRLSGQVGAVRGGCEPVSKEEVRARLDLSALVGEYVVLQSVGAGRFKGLCPFHKEKSPSFQVDSARGYYYCFGCKAGGDAFSFLMAMEHVSFGDALEKLALRTGVVLERRQGERERSHRDVYEVNELALTYFREQLEGPALDYFRSRGLTDATLSQFELGFAPPGYDGLLKFARGRGVSEQQLLAAGLVSENEQGRIYDKFRARVMFPIRDPLGRLVGFGGRVLDESKPKYLNSPETEVFRKGELLYGLHLARREATGSELVVVEGYMDVIAMHQAGFKTAVATLGTALTGEHATLLSRQGIGSVALLFDSDAAGQKATLSALDQTIGSSLLVRALVLPSGKDPAEAIQAGDLDGLKSALEHGLDEVELRVHYALERFNVETVEGKRLFLDFLLPRMQSPNHIDLAGHIAHKVRKLVAEKIEINEDRLSEWIDSKTKYKTLSTVQMVGMLEGRAGEELRERQLARFMLNDPELMQKLEGSSFRSRLVNEVMDLLKLHGSREAVFDAFRGRPEEKEVLELMFGGERLDMMDSEGNKALLERQQLKSIEGVLVLESRRTEDELRAEIVALKKQLASLTGDEQYGALRQIGELQKAVEAEKRSRIGRARA